MNFFPTALADETVVAAPTGAPDPVPVTGDSTTFIFLIGAMILFYFVLMRPNSKRRKEQQKLLDSIKPGDDVLTNGGIIGKVVKVSDDKDILTLEISENSRIKVKRAYIVSPLPKGSYDESKVVAKK